MFPEQIILIGVLLNIIGYYFYFKNMFFGQTKPNLISWSIWMLAPFLGVFFQMQAGAGWSVLPIFMAGFISLLVVIVSIFKNDGYWKINTFDIICGLTSLIALVLYILTHNLGISILFAIMSDALAYIPTIRKSWIFPDTETSLMYITGIISNIIGLLIIKTWTFPIYSFGISITVFNLVVVFCIYRKKIISIFS